MKSLSLTILERLGAINCVINNPENKVPMENMKVFLEDAAKFGITEDERKEIGWVDLKEDKGTPEQPADPEKITGFKWEKADYVKEFEIDEFTRKFLSEKIQKLETYAGDPYAAPLASLSDKLK